MESKLNHERIERYSKEYAKKICDQFFQSGAQISGEEILQLTPVKQVNLMVLKNLFQKWNKESAKLQSPYFDYHKSEVKEALSRFMNVLSRHISIDKAHTEPLLTKAVQDTLLLISSPYEFYAKEINNHKDKSRISREELKSLKKYIRLNTHLLETLLQKFEERKLDQAFNDEAFDLLNEACEDIQQEPDQPEETLQQFSATLPLKLDELYLEIAEKKAEHPAKEKKIEAPQTEHDEITKGKPIDNLKKNLSINQRFMFVNQLFAGDAEAFAQAVDRIDALQKWKEAQDIIEKEFASRHDWDMESEEVLEFLEMVERRFA